MDNLTKQLTEKQLQENIDHLFSQNVNQKDIQDYVNQYKKDASGNYVLGGDQPSAPSYTEQRLPYTAKAVNNFRKGEYVAGGFNTANQMLSEASRPFQMANEALRQVPVVGKPLSNLLSIPPYLASKAVEYGTQGIQATGIPSMMNNLLPLDKSGEAAKAINTTNQMIAPFLVAPVLAKGAMEAPQLFNGARQTVADALSQSAYKIPPSIKGSAKTDILRTSQEYGITPRAKGIEKLDSKVGELKSFTDNLEQQAQSSQTQSVRTSDLLNNIDQLKEKWSKGDTPETFNRVLDGYKSAVLNQKKPDLTVTEMVDLKRNLQNQLKKVYQQQMKINPSIRQSILQEAKSNLENSVRSKLEEIIPEYADANSKIHKLLKLKPFVDQAANRISNADLLNVRFKDLFFGGATGIVTHDPFATLAATVFGRFITDPRTQAYLANKIAPNYGGQTFQAPASALAITQLPLNQNDNK